MVPSHQITCSPMTWRQWVCLEGLYKPSYLHWVHCFILKTSKIKDNKNTNGKNKIQAPNTQSKRRNTPGQTHGSMLEMRHNSYHKVNYERVWDSRSFRWPDHDTLWHPRLLQCPKALGAIRSREPHGFQGFCEPEEAGPSSWRPAPPTLMGFGAMGWGFLPHHTEPPFRTSSPQWSHSKVSWSLASVCPLVLWQCCTYGI